MTSSDPDPQQCVDGLRAAHAVLDEVVGELTDEVARRPSLLPDWTVGHVLTHLARNADSVVRRLDGAARGEIVDQYAGGASGRAADIESGAGRPAAEIADDVRRTSAEVERACAALDADGWQAMTRNLSGVVQPASDVVFSRWREVEVHLVDLGLGYRVDRWPAGLVHAWLPEVLAELPQRTDPAQLLGWALGRAPAPALGEWG